MNKTFNPATSRFLYLNNSGSRGVRIDSNGNRETLPVQFETGGKVKQIAVKYWRQLGNFSFPVVRQGKQLIHVYPDSEVETKKWLPFDVKYPTENSADMYPPKVYSPLNKK